MLHLVHPARPGGQERPRPSKGRRSPALFLTGDEERHLRAAIKNTARAYGGLDVLAAVVGVTHKALMTAIHSRSRHLSGTLALRIAKASGMSTEAIIGGQLSAVGRCEACGSRVGDRAERRAS